MSSFVSLHNHTHYSILKALPSPKELLLKAKELGQTAIAITDNNTFAGVWESYKASKEIGVKLIIGGVFNFLNDINKKDEKLCNIVLIAKNAEGYKNLLLLNKYGFDNAIITGNKIIPIIDWNVLEEKNSGLLCLTGDGNGIVSHHINNKNFDIAKNNLNRLYNLFGNDLGVEIQANTWNRPGNMFFSPINQVFTNYQLIKLANELSIKIIPTTNTLYIKKEDFKIHDVLLAVGAMQPVYSNARLKYNVPDFYLKTYEEVRDFFARNYGNEFAEQICTNTLEFANKCENPDWVNPQYLNPAGKELPVFDISNTEDYQQFKNWLEKQNEQVKKLNEDSAYLRFKCFDVFDKKIKPTLSLLKIPEYTKRIENELDVLNHQGFSSYMLIVADYIEWSKKNGVAAGVGRGSIGGSYTAYLLGIHKADPIKYGLIFERFQNIEKTSFPDIDADFSTKNRNKVLNYIQTKYGNDHVAFISNFSRVTPKVYARDIARSLEFGDNRKEAVRIGNQIADSISKDVKDKLDFEDLKASPLFMEYVKRYPPLANNSQILGKIRNFSTHAAALVISKRSLIGLVPVRKDKDGQQALEYEKNNTEDNGLLKVDILGLSTLDLIDDTIELINKTRDINLKLEDINFEDYDKKTYDLISKGDNFGVFQLGTSGGTIDLCKKIKPRCIEDLAIITTLARPAAANIRNDFIKTREGKSEFKLLHPSLKNAFEKTFGFGLYDESILQLGQDVAGWSLNQADRIRKMIKDKGKNPEKDKKLREEFIMDTMKNHNLDKIMATRIWDEELSKFRGYTFNKSLHHKEKIDIYTSEGKFLNTKSIDNIIPGEFVKSRNETNKKEIFVEVINKHDHGILPLFEVELVSGEKFRCTMDHKFRVQENGEMLPLEQIIKENLSIVANTAVNIPTIMSNIKSIQYIGNHRAYDIEVNHPDHQFYLSNGVLTSNSHAVLYSFISYITAYLKSNYPIEFLLATLIREIGSNAPNAQENIDKAKSELRKHKVNILSPDINKSETHYTLIDKNNLLTGLDALKYVGEDAIKDIIAKRPFKDFNDLMLRCDTRKVRTSTIQALAGGGCLDKFGIPRKIIYLYCYDYRKKLQVWLKKHNPNEEQFIFPWPNEPEWSKPELFALEKYYLGESFICSKREAYGSFFNDQHANMNIIKSSANKTYFANIKAEIKNIHELKVKKEGSKLLGQEMAKVLLEDVFGNQGVLTIFPEQWSNIQYQIKLQKGKLGFAPGHMIKFSGYSNLYDNEMGIILDQLFQSISPLPLPKDLKAKKLNLNNDNKDNILNKSDSLQQQIEDELFTEGLVDLDEDPFSTDI